MKKAIYTSIIALALVFSANAYAAQGMYVSVDAGLAMSDDIDVTLPRDFPGAKFSFEFDTGAAFSGAIGYRMENFRVEGEVGYQKNDFDTTEISAFNFNLAELETDGDVNIVSFLANAYYDFPTGSRFTPFISAGLGVAQVEVNDLFFPRIPGGVTATEDDTVFAWQVGAGVSYAISSMLDLELKYRYFVTEDPEFEGDITFDGPTSHNVYLGMRFNF